MTPVFLALALGVVVLALGALGGWLPPPRFVERHRTATWGLTGALFVCFLVLTALQFVGVTEPANEEECIRQSRTDTPAEAFVATWYCETAFANIWVDGKPTMIDENRALILQHFELFDPRDRQSPKFGDISGVDADVRADYGVERYFDRFPDYVNRFSLTVGQVRAVTKLADATSTSNDWVAQLGTVQMEGIILYSRFSAPLGWEPPRMCDIGLTAGIPIAYGTTSQPGGLQKYQVVYQVSPSFLCLPALDADLTEEELRRAFEQGDPYSSRPAVGGITRQSRLSD